jgi:regulator-associated protein of mTOR
LVSKFLSFAEQREKDYKKMISSNSAFTASSTSTSSTTLVKDFILLAACSAHEILPMNPDLPADIFTSCLTTPIKIALKWYLTIL